MTPEDFEISAKTLKRFFKDTFGIPVRVETGKSKHPYINVWIPSKPGLRHTDPLVYDHAFTAEFGNLCLGVIYGAESETGKQAWAGNVRPNMIAMHAHEWQKVLCLATEKFKKAA